MIYVLMVIIINMKKIKIPLNVLTVVNLVFIILENIALVHAPLLTHIKLKPNKHVMHNVQKNIIFLYLAKIVFNIAIRANLLLMVNVQINVPKI